MGECGGGEPMLGLLLLWSSIATAPWSSCTTSLMVGRCTLLGSTLCRAIWATFQSASWFGRDARSLGSRMASMLPCLRFARSCTSIEGRPVMRSRSTIPKLWTSRLGESLDRPKSATLASFLEVMRMLWLFTSRCIQLGLHPVCRAFTATSFPPGSLP